MTALEFTTTTAPIGKPPRQIRVCLQALGVSYRKGTDFWTEHSGELEWILRDAHRAWRLKIKSAHTDTGGSHERATYWNGVWARVEQVFGSHGVKLDKIAGGPRPSVIMESRTIPLPPPEPKRKRQRAFNKVQWGRAQYRRRVGIPIDAPLHARAKSFIDGVTA